MPVEITPRDYSLIGLDSKLAVETGLSAAQWYACPIPRKRLKELMKRKDGPAIRDTLIWFASLAAGGGIAFEAWGTWWALPAFFV
jgi:fatty acid desaturase